MLFIFNELRTATAAATSDKLGEILLREGPTLTVAIADPNNVTAIEDIKFITRCDVFPVIAGEYTLRNAIDKYYQQSDAQLQTLLKDIEAADDLEVVEEQTDEDVKAQD